MSHLQGAVVGNGAGSVGDGLDFLFGFGCRLGGIAVGFDVGLLLKLGGGVACAFGVKVESFGGGDATALSLRTLQMLLEFGIVVDARYGG